MTTEITVHRSLLAGLRRIAPLLAAVEACERLSRDVALRQATLAPTPALAHALRQQGRQETLHAAAFAAVNSLVREDAVCPQLLGRALDAFASRLRADFDVGALAASMLGLQCSFEGLACVALRLPPGEIQALGTRFLPLLDLVQHQERAHLRLGEVWMPRLSDRTSERERVALRQSHADYCGLAERMTEAALHAFDGTADDRAHYVAATGDFLASLRANAGRLIDPAATR
jgi:hypothetical protein